MGFGFSPNVEYVYIHHKKKGVKWDINYSFSEKATMTIAAKTVLHEDVMTLLEKYNFIAFLCKEISNCKF